MDLANLTSHPLLIGTGLAALAILLHRAKRPWIKLTYGWAWIYVLSDRNNPRLHKIGLTRRKLETRMDEVYWSMAGGAELRLVYAVYTPFAATVEMLAHQNMRLRRYRSERGTEWFWCSDREATKAVDRAYRLVRQNAKGKRLWSDEADRRVRSVV